MAKDIEKKDLVLRYALMGVAASLINDRTLHLVLRLDLKARDYQAATDARLSSM